MIPDITCCVAAAASVDKRLSYISVHLCEYTTVNVYDYTTSQVYMRCNSTHVHEYTTVHVYFKYTTVHMYMSILCTVTTCLLSDEWNICSSASWYSLILLLPRQPATTDNTQKGGSDVILLRNNQLIATPAGRIESLQQLSASSVWILSHLQFLNRKLLWVIITSCSLRKTEYILLLLWLCTTCSWTSTVQRTVGQNWFHAAKCDWIQEDVLFFYILHLTCCVLGRVW